MPERCSRARVRYAAPNTGAPLRPPRRSDRIDIATDGSGGMSSSERFPTTANPNRKSYRDGVYTESRTPPASRPLSSPNIIISKNTMRKALLTLLAATPRRTQPTTPAPDFEVQINGKPTFVHDTPAGPFVHFSLAGPTEITIKSAPTSNTPPRRNWKPGASATSRNQSPSLSAPSISGRRAPTSPPPSTAIPSASASRAPPISASNSRATSPARSFCSPPRRSRTRPSPTPPACATSRPARSMTWAASS